MKDFSKSNKDFEYEYQVENIGLIQGNSNIKKVRRVGELATLTH